VKSYQARFADEALDDLGRIFAELLTVAGERIARDFVERLKSITI
jgi:hypothetical protein